MNACSQSSTPGPGTPGEPRTRVAASLLASRRNLGCVSSAFSRKCLVQMNRFSSPSPIGILSRTRQSGSGTFTHGRLGFVLIFLRRVLCGVSSFKRGVRLIITSLFGWGSRVMLAFFARCLRAGGFVSLTKIHRKTGATVLTWKWSRIFGNARFTFRFTRQAASRTVPISSPVANGDASVAVDWALLPLFKQASASGGCYSCGASCAGRTCPTCALEIGRLLPATFEPSEEVRDSQISCRSPRVSVSWSGAESTVPRCSLPLASALPHVVPASDKWLAREGPLDYFHLQALTTRECWDVCSAIVILGWAAGFYFLYLRPGCRSAGSEPLAFEKQ